MESTRPRLLGPLAGHHSEHLAWRIGALREETSGPQRVVWIARRHILWDGDEASCFVAADGAEGTGIARRVPLRLTAPHGEGFLVEGPADGTQLLTHPLERLSDGAEIRLEGAGR